MIEVYWDDDEQTIVRLDYTDPVVDWDEYRTAVKKSHDMIAEVNYIVNVIHNPDNTKMPSGNPFSHLQYAVYSSPPNTACVVMVITNWFARQIISAAYQTITRKHYGNYHMAKSLDEAYEIIENESSTLA